jgi:uncharacterized BrkB/YihY/UPF0761 family membrane protein
MKSEAVSSHVLESPSFPPYIPDSVPLVARLLLSPVVRNLCRCKRGVLEHVFILEHYFASKSFAAVRETFNNAYSDKEVPNKTTVLMSTFKLVRTVALGCVLNAVVCTKIAVPLE